MARSKIENVDQDEPIKYSAEEIKNFDNPYLMIGQDSDSLAANADELNKLSKEEMINVASKMVLACPQKDLNKFGTSLESLRRPHDDQKTFHSVIFGAYTVKKLIYALIDDKNPKPHTMIMGEDFNGNLYTTFNALALDVLKNNETKIAQRLAINTQRDNQEQLINKVNSLFPKSEFSKQVKNAISFGEELDKTLLGDDPIQFFNGLNEDKKIGLCQQYFDLLETKITGHEKDIGAKLAKAIQDNKGTASDINLKIERINRRAKTEYSPLREIYSAMAQQLEPKKKPVIPKLNITTSAGTNPKSLFNSINKSSTPNYDKDEKKSDCCSRLFGCF